MDDQDTRSVTRRHGPHSTGGAADRTVLDHEQAVADGDRETALADQTLSDADQAASERDDADAARDQKSADRDQASADARRADEGDPADPGTASRAATYEATRAERRASRVDRLETHADRGSSAGARLGTSQVRDRNAARRDDAAKRRDLRAIALEESLPASDAPLRAQLTRLRKRAAMDRAAAADDRLRAATERTEAATELGLLRAELHGAHLDGLTGAFHRETGGHALALEIDRARRGDGRLVLARVGVVDLRGVNDRAGHAVGDQVLRTLVATMRSNLRSFDPIVRSSGNEFHCAVAGVEIGEVQRRFDGIGSSLYADTGVGVTVGLATLAEGETLDQLTARAGAALVDATQSPPA